MGLAVDQPCCLPFEGSANPHGLGAIALGRSEAHASNLPSLIHSALVLRRRYRVLSARLLAALKKDGGVKVAMSGRVGPQWLKFPTLRIRAKVLAGFAVVLAISAASMGIAYLGFERVSAGVATYRSSVSEADLARNIDRELISYQALARRGGGRAGAKD